MVINFFKVGLKNININRRLCIQFCIPCWVSDLCLRYAALTKCRKKKQKSRARSKDTATQRKKDHEKVYSTVNLFIPLFNWKWISSKPPLPFMPWQWSLFLKLKNVLISLSGHLCVYVCVSVKSGLGAIRFCNYKPFAVCSINLLSIHISATEHGASQQGNTVRRLYSDWTFARFTSDTKRISQCCQSLFY